MNNPSPTTPPPDPEEEEAMRSIAQEREEKYGGRDRWTLTVVFIIAAICAVWEFWQKQPLALFFVACAVVCGVMAFINWRSWLKKTPAEKQAVPSDNIFQQLEIKEGSAPYSKSEFLELRKKFSLNLSLSVFAFLFAMIGFLGAVPRLQLLPVRIICLVIGAAAIFLGRRPAQRVWRAGKTSLACPKCHDLLTSQRKYILRTGHCRKCGTVILTNAKDASTPSEDASTRFEIRAGAPRIERGTGEFQYDPARIFDAFILLSGPAFCLFYFCWNFFPPGVRLLVGIMTVGIAAFFSFASDDLLDGKSHSGSGRSRRKTAPIHDTDNSSNAGNLPFFDFAVMLAFPIAMVAGLCYLVWLHHVLTQLQLAVVAIALPGAIVLVSYAVGRHEAYHVKKTGKPASERFGWTIIGFWAMAVFIFVVCVVCWIEKYVMK